MDGIIGGPEPGRRLAAKTQSIQEAEDAARRFEAEGYSAEIRRISRSGITIYEVWISRKPDVFSAGK